MLFSIKLTTNYCRENSAFCTQSSGGLRTPALARDMPYRGLTRDRRLTSTTCLLQTNQRPSPPSYATREHSRRVRDLFRGSCRNNLSHVLFRPIRLLLQRPEITKYLLGLR